MRKLFDQRDRTKGERVEKTVGTEGERHVIWNKDRIGTIPDRFQQEKNDDWGMKKDSGK